MFRKHQFASSSSTVRSELVLEFQILALVLFVSTEVDQPLMQDDATDNIDRADIARFENEGGVVIHE